MNGVTIGKKHSWNDWGLWLLNKPDIQPPEVKSVILDIPGADGVLDLTESLTGEVQYGTRKIEMELHLVDAVNRWTGIYSKISNYLHGRQMRIVFDDDKAYYWEGRVYVKSWKSSRLHGVIALEAEVDPYKYELQASNEPWKWDPFNFETGVIRNYGNIAIDGTGLIQVVGSRRPITPTIHCSASGMSLKIVGKNLATLTYGNRVPSVTTGEMVSANGWSSDFIPIDNGRNYFIKYHSTTSARYILLYRADKSFIGWTNVPESGRSTSGLSGWSDARFVKLRSDNASTKDPQAQFELGSTATDYEPYTEQTYELSKGDNIIPQIVVKNEEYNYIFSGNGNVSIIFRGGSL